MTYRHILVPLFGYDGDRVSLDAALSLARQSHGHIAALHVETDPLEQTPLMIDVGVAITELVEAATKHAERRARHAAETFARWQKESGIPIDDNPRLHAETSTAFRSIKGNEEDILAHHGRLTDIVVMARPRRDQAVDLVAMRVEDVLFGAGRPVLLIPGGADAALLQRALAGPALIAWNGSIEATRAVAAAIDLVRPMKLVRVLSIAEGRGHDRKAAELVHYLGWHGIAATIAETPAEGGTEQRILTAAKAANAGLIVLGAYSHGRLRQLMLGGVTSHMLDECDLPILMAH